MYAAATHRFEDARKALRFLFDFAPEAPREVTSGAVFSKMEDGSAVVSVSACHIAPLDNAEATLSPIINFGSPIATRLERRPYLSVQCDADERFPYGQNYYWKTHLVKELSDEAINTLVERYTVVPNDKTLVVFQQFGGAVRDIAPSETAFANRDAEFDFIPAAIWHEETEANDLINWVRGTWEAMKPHASGGVYLNSLGDEGDRLNEAVGANEIKLRKIKAKYDPDNFFRLNANVQPASD